MICFTWLSVKDRNKKVIHQPDPKNFQVAETLNSGICDWKEFPLLKLVSTVGDGHVLFVQRLFENLEIQDFLVKSQTGKRTSTAQKKEQIIALSFLQTECSHILIGMTESGAILRMKREQNELSTTSLISEKSLSRICRYCKSLVNDSTNLQKHILKLQIGPVVCKMCMNLMDDVCKLNSHM